MNKYILVCFFLAMPAVFAVTCDASGDAIGTKLRTQLSVTAEANSATLGAASTLTYCSGLAATASCCSTATINAFQTKINAVITAIQDAEALRDAAYVSLRTSSDTGIPSTFTGLLEINIAATAALAKIDTLTPTATYADLRAQIVLAQNFLIGAVTKIATTKVAFAGYLENRATCVRKLAETQASIYCLSCRVDIGTDYGVTAPSTLATVPYPTAYKTALAGACYDYLNGAQSQAGLYDWFLTTNAISTLKTKLADLTTNGATSSSAATDTSDLSTALGTTEAPTADTQEIPTLTSCTSTSACDYVYTDLLTNGAMISNLKVAAGGTITSGTRLLAEENNRMLQTSYDPAANSAGISTSTVVANPGNVDTSSALRQGVFGCIIALVAMLLF